MAKTKLLTPLAPRSDAKGYLKSLFRGERSYLGICFILPVIIMWIIYICMQVFPFGEESVLVLDLNGQYVYFFEELKNIIYGDGSLLYSFSRPLGGEFFGIFAYYLSSPFSFIVALFPASYMTEALLIMFLLKTGCCGLTFGVYIDATRKRNPVSTVLFSAMYALCGYAVVMQHNTMWIDNLILLPIIMLGIENLIKYGKIRNIREETRCLYRFVKAASGTGENLAQILHYLFGLFGYAAAYQISRFGVYCNLSRCIYRTAGNYCL